MPKCPPLLCLALPIALLLTPSLCSLTGVTLITAYPESTFSCLAQRSFTHISVQAFTNYGTLNPNATHNLQSALNHGFTTDIVMNHCSGKDPTAQARQLLNGIPNNLYNMVWITVDQNPSAGCRWAQHTPAKDCEYLRALAAAVAGMGKKVGVYVAYNYWQQVFKSSTYCYQLGGLPLWYGSFDAVESFEDFKPFGGWTQPYRKNFGFQYELCDTIVTENWTPAP